ncbi:hypothetical protein BpKM390_29180 [Burkholderia pseudomallei]|nr:conserved hypothetical protein [Burkholderia pseudomallei MSHR346]BEH49559.1 hypothetical protein TKS_27910 [Burkholderia pseudomallei]BEH61673.1 hypothetical protein BpKM390_29180 [Burkholderia pseudomallei]
MVTLNIGSIGQTSHDADSIKERRTGEARRPRTSTMVAPGMFGVARERAVPCRVALQRVRHERKKARLRRRVQAGQFRMIGRLAARGERPAGGEYEGWRAGVPIVLSDSA